LSNVVVLPLFNFALFLPNSNGGQTLDHQNFKMPLVAGQWKDFGLPFNFSINMQDILAASLNYPDVIWEYNPNWNASSTPPVLSWTRSEASSR
jgi:hypothetical protein